MLSLNGDLGVLPHVVVSENEVTFHLRTIVVLVVCIVCVEHDEAALDAHQCAERWFSGIGVFDLSLYEDQGLPVVIVLHIKSSLDVGTLTLQSNVCRDLCGGCAQLEVAVSVGVLSSVVEVVGEIGGVEMPLNRYLAVHFRVIGVILVGSLSGVDLAVDVHLSLAIRCLG